MWPRSNQWEWALLGKISSYITVSNINLEGIELSLECLARKLWSVCRRSSHPAVTLLVSPPRNQNRFYKTISNTFTASFSLYSSHLSLSELNLILYDVTHKEGSEGLPCVASFASSLSFQGQFVTTGRLHSLPVPRRLGGHLQLEHYLDGLAKARAQRWKRRHRWLNPAPLYFPFQVHEYRILEKEEEKKQFNSLFKATLFIWCRQFLVGSPQHRLLEPITAGL